MPVSSHFVSQLSRAWEIYFSQCYPNALLKIPELSNLIQLTAAAHADLGGVGFADLSGYHQSWVMNRMRIEIDKLPSWGDIVEVRTWIEELKGVKSVRNFEIRCHGDKYIGISTLWAIFNTRTRRPDSLVIDTSHVERYPDLHATSIANRKLSADFDVQEEFEYTVQFADLDIVNHVNNIKYLEWCLNYVDEEIILANRIKAIDLNFLKELALRESVIISKATVGNIIHFKITKGETVCFLCEMEVL